MRAYLMLGAIGIAIVASACSTPQSASDTPTASAAASPTTTPSASVGASVGSLTEAEIGTLTGGSRVPFPATAPSPAISAAAAEATVRAKYPGQRTTIGVVRIAMNLPSGVVVTGWFVALTPADGAACDLHAGLLPRAIEGGVVDDQAGDVDWVFSCGP